MYRKRESGKARKQESKKARKQENKANGRARVNSSFHETEKMSIPPFFIFVWSTILMSAQRPEGV
jgi:hypothetical protein